MTVAIWDDSSVLWDDPLVSWDGEVFAPPLVPVIPSYKQFEYIKADAQQFANTRIQGLQFAGVQMDDLCFTFVLAKAVRFDVCQSSQ